MKLHKLHKQTNADILRHYLKDLRNLYESSRKSDKVLNEAKITITIDDDHKVGISQDAKLEFVEKAKALGQFDNQEWVDGLIKSMEQAGVQGFHKICEDEKPVTNKQIQHLIGLLVNLVSK
jgi:hypothetical protein